MVSTQEIASVLRLRPVPLRREWRGDCPSCGYASTLVLAERDGRALWWCASCEDREAVTAAVRRAMGGEWKTPSTAASRRAPSATTAGRQAARALALWDEALPLPRSPAARYLAARAIPDVVSV
jgi:ribosomal protein L37AE/L43A